MTTVLSTTLGALEGCTVLNGALNWHYGVSAPTSTWSFQNWGDTSANLWKQRNQADTDWITRGILDASYFGLATSATVTSLTTDVTTGWIPITNTLTYSSADDPTYVAQATGVDLTGTIGLGSRIKVTQVTGGTKYFIVTKVELSGSDTLISMFGGTGASSYNLENEAISNPYYSMVKAPFGFPVDPTIYCVEVTDTSNRSQATPTQNQWYNLGTLSISIPIGFWNVSYLVQGSLAESGATAVAGYITLSTANNTESDVDFTSMIHLHDSSTVSYAHLTRFKYLNLTSKTSYYLNTRTTTASVDTIYNRGDLAKTIIRAVCAYL